MNPVLVRQALICLKGLHPQVKDRRVIYIYINFTESYQILLNFIPAQHQDIQAQTLLLSMGASWGDHPGHLVVPSSVTDVELYLFGQNVS